MRCFFQRRLVFLARDAGNEKWNALNLDHPINFGFLVSWCPGFLVSLEEPNSFPEDLFEGGSKLNRRGRPQVLVHVSTYQGSILVPVF